MTDSSCEPEQELSKPIFSNGVYANPFKEWEDPTFLKAVKWMFTQKNNSSIPRKEALNSTLPIIKPDLDELSKVPATGLRVTWIGHATVLVQFDNITVLTDPVFSQRAAPTQYAGPKRYRNVPLTIDELPKIDAVIISHNHYDHLDYHSVVKLNKRFGGQLWWYVPIGLKSWLNSVGCQNVVQLSWWQEAEFPNSSEIKFACTPCMHWSLRSGFDWNKTLWSSWAVIGPKHRFYFGGDTGYCSVFEQIGKKYGPFTLAALPIAAYCPRWLMRPQHVNPEEAVQIHVDVKAQRSIGIHWGTFRLTDEHYLEPKLKIVEEVKKRGLEAESFFTTNHGEIKYIEDDD